jgi:hypothetical protein
MRSGVLVIHCPERESQISTHLNSMIATTFNTPSNTKDRK